MQIVYYIIFLFSFSIYAQRTPECFRTIRKMDKSNCDSINNVGRKKKCFLEEIYYMSDCYSKERDNIEDRLRHTKRRKSFDKMLQEKELIKHIKEQKQSAENRLDLSSEDEFHELGWINDTIRRFKQKCAMRYKNAIRIAEKSLDEFIQKYRELKLKNNIDQSLLFKDLEKLRIKILRAENNYIFGKNHIEGLFQNLNFKKHIPNAVKALNQTSWVLDQVQLQRKRLDSFLDELSEDDLVYEDKESFVFKEFVKYKKLCQEEQEGCYFFNLYKKLCLSLDSFEKEKCQ